LYSCTNEGSYYKCSLCILFPVGFTNEGSYYKFSPHSLGFYPSLLKFICGSLSMEWLPVYTFSATPTITITKLNWKNCLSYFASMELWFLVQGYHDHLEKKVCAVSDEDKLQWQKLDFHLWDVLWQSVEYDVLEIFRSFKTCSYVGKRRRIFLLMTFKVCDSKSGLYYTDQSWYDLTSSKGSGCNRRIEEISCGWFIGGYQQKTWQIIQNSNSKKSTLRFDHVCDQILAADQIISMDSLVTRLFQVSTLLKNENPVDVIETRIVAAEAIDTKGFRSITRQHEMYIIWMKYCGSSSRIFYIWHNL